MEKRLISIWFFIGALLATYGVLILGSGIYRFFAPSSDAVVLLHLHLEIWWGAGMCVLGLVYVVRYWPESGQGSYRTRRRELDRRFAVRSSVNAGDLPLPPFGHE